MSLKRRQADCVTTPAPHLPGTPRRFILAESFITDLSLGTGFAKMECTEDTLHSGDKRCFLADLICHHYS